MKKFFLTSIMIILFISVELSNAQIIEPCLPDCPDSVWIPAFPEDALELNIVLCNEAFIIRYRHRFACSIWFDYYIEAIYPVAEGAGVLLNCIDEYGGIAELMQAAIEQLIIINPANFPPVNEGDCEDNWRVLKGSCWQMMYILGTGAIVNKSEKPQENEAGHYHNPQLEPCTPNDCCLERFTVCLMRGQRVITQSEYLPPEDPDCNGYGECVPVCGSVYNR